MKLYKVTILSALIGIAAGCTFDVKMPEFVDQYAADDKENIDVVETDFIKDNYAKIDTPEIHSEIVDLQKELEDIMAGKDTEKPIDVIDFETRG